MSKNYLNGRCKMFFEKIENLSELERNNKWRIITDHLYDNWQSDKLNSNKILRVGAECWYILSEWEFLKINTNELTQGYVKEKLIEVTNFAIENFSTDAKVLSIFGYMISIFPFYFYNDNDTSNNTYLQFEKMGKAMLKKAYELNNSNEIYELLYFNSLKEPSKDFEAKKQTLQNKVSTYFSNETEVERYFNEILTNGI